jgi:hypothetical protein
MRGMDHARESPIPPLSFDLGSRRAWFWLSLGVALVTVAESVALAAILSALLPDPLAVVLVAVIVLPMAALVIAIASALTGRITVDADQVRLRFGMLGGALMQRADIVRVERFRPAVVRPIGLGIDIPTGTRQATVSLGGPVRYVRVVLREPIMVRTALWRRSEANELVLGTGTPDQLVAALA